MGGFDFSAYNKLLPIANANARFEEQLTSAGLTRAQLLSELAPLFLEAPYAGLYVACLIHRHYALNDGERMVTAGLSTKPSTEASPNIVCERWSSSGEEIEHKFTDNTESPPSPPPTDFFTRFRSILDAHGIDILGVCYAPDELVDGFIFLESPGPGDREQVLAIAHFSSSEVEDSLEAAWSPKFNPEDGSYPMSACCNCTNGGCNDGACSCGCSSRRACTCGSECSCRCNSNGVAPVQAYQGTHQVGKPFLFKEAQTIAKFEITI